MKNVKQAKATYARKILVSFLSPLSSIADLLWLCQTGVKSDSHIQPNFN